MKRLGSVALGTLRYLCAELGQIRATGSPKRVHHECRKSTVLCWHINYSIVSANSFAASAFSRYLIRCDRDAQPEMLQNEIRFSSTE